MSEERKNVKNNYQLVCEKIEKIEKEKPFNYQTSTKYVPKIGLITDVTTVKDIVKLQTIVDEQKSKFNEAAKKLGISEDELDEEETTFMGYSLDIWEDEIKQRLNEIKQLNLLSKLQKAKKVLKKNLSADDKFLLDMDSINDVLSLDDFNI